MVIGLYPRPSRVLLDCNVGMFALIPMMRQAFFAAPPQRIPFIRFKMVHVAPVDHLSRRFWIAWAFFWGTKSAAVQQGFVFTIELLF